MIPDGLHVALNHGFRVFPCRTGDKRPLTKHGCKDASDEVVQVIEWSREFPGCNWGAAMGAGIFALDLDRKGGADGSAELATLIDRNGPLPMHLINETPNAGEHHLFRGAVVGNTASKVAPGVDVRTDGGYIVIPPSHLKVGAYRWREPDAPIPDAPGWLLELLRARAIPEGQRNDTLYRYACGLRARNLPFEDAWSALQLRNLDCAPLLDERELRQILESAWRHAPGYPPSDTGNAQRLLAYHGHDLRYLKGKREWIVWDREQGRWIGETDGLSCVARVKQTIIAALGNEVPHLPSPKEQRLYAAWLIQSQNTNRLEAAVRNARSEAGVVIDPVHLDADRYRIGTMSGTLNLRDGTHRPAQREDWITKQLGCAFNSQATAPRWHEFLVQASGNDAAMQAYLQQTVGLSLLGNLFRLVIFIYGPTATGKSVFLEVIKALFGDYARAAATDLLMLGSLRTKHGPTEALARLAGARLVTVSETTSGDQFDEGLLKDLTGRDVITARNMFQSSFEFRPDFTIWIRGNHKPRFSGDDAAMLERLRLIPFTHQVPESKRDPLLLESIVASELPGVLNWAVAGALAVQAHGALVTPPVVQVATREYALEMDLLGAYIEDRCDTGNPQGSVSAQELYDAFRTWCEQQGLRYPWTQQTFGRRMSERFAKRKHRDRWIYEGISVRPGL